MFRNFTFLPPGKKWKVMVIGVLAGAAVAQHGVPVDGYPNWQERAVIVLTNICRIDPGGFRGAFSPYTNILEKYPAVDPLYWNVDLNRVARAHATDMATGCGLQHASCDGTPTGTRIRRVYTRGSGWGENIAYGNSSPLKTVLQWIHDMRGSSPAPDLSGGDGHRKNIMNSRFRETGAGHHAVAASRRSRPFWVQDFGSGKPAAAPPLVCGSHLFITGDSTTFMVNYHDPGSAAPLLQVTVEGRTVPMQRRFGAQTNGTYCASLKRADSCRQYYFTAHPPAGPASRYPVSGTLMTFGEGVCEQDFAELRAVNRDIHFQHIPGPRSISFQSLQPSRTVTVFLFLANGRILPLPREQRTAMHPILDPAGLRNP